MAPKESSRKYQWLEAVHRSGLTPKTKNVGWAIFYHANVNTLRCWPNYDTLDAVLGGKGNGKNIGDQVKALQNAGFLKIGKEPGKQYKSNGYWLTFPEPDEEKSTPEEQNYSLDEGPDSLDGEGVTLSRTLSTNPFSNSFIEKPSASVIQEEIRRMGDQYFS